MNFIKAFIQRCRTSLVYKYLLVFVIGALIPVFMLGLWSFWMSNRALNLHISDSVYQVLKEKIDYTTLLLQETESLIANISGVEDITNTLQMETDSQSDYDKLRLQANVGYILSGYINIPGLESIDIFSAKGRQYHVGESLLQNANNNYPLVTQIIRENAVAKSSIVWHGIRKSPNNPGKYSLIASKRLFVIDPESMLERYVGTVIVQYSVAAFNQKFSQNKQAGITYIILDTKGNCIYSPNRKDIGLPFFATNSLVISGSEENFIYARFNKERVYLLKSKSMMNGWQYYALLHGEYFSSISRVFTRGTLIILLLILSISILINAYYFRYMLRPIKVITNGLQEISSGSYDLYKKLPNPHKDEIGDLIKWFNNFTDNLIEKESYHKDIQVQKELAERANEAKSTFLASISHELRTPLNGVIAVAELLEKTDLNPEQQDYLHTILQSGDILYSLINQVLDYSKITTNKAELIPVVFDLISLCDNLAAIYRVQAEIKKIEFRYEKPELPELFIEADQLALQKIIINLIGNSLKFTKSGTIKFELVCEKLDPRDVDLTIRVTDTGIGIAEDKHEIIFKAFEQADNALAKTYEGTGLGLAIAQQLAQMMDSHIHLQSPLVGRAGSDNPGAAFWMHLSLKRSLKNSSQSAQKTPKLTPAVIARFPRQLKSLIVEDNLINQKVLNSVLSKFGMHNTIASDWTECLDAIDQQSFDYIFMDIQMPGKTGLELTEIIRDKGITTPIIAITGNAFKEIEDQAYAIGMNAFLSKPIRSNELEEAVIRFLPWEFSHYE